MSIFSIQVKYVVVGVIPAVIASVDVIMTAFVLQLLLLLFLLLMLLFEVIVDIVNCVVTTNGWCCCLLTSQIKSESPGLHIRSQRRGVTPLVLF